MILVPNLCNQIRFGTKIATLHVHLRMKQIRSNASPSHARRSGRSVAIDQKPFPTVCAVRLPL